MSLIEEPRKSGIFLLDLPDLVITLILHEPIVLKMLQTSKVMRLKCTAIEASAYVTRWTRFPHGLWLGDSLSGLNLLCKVTVLGLRGCGLKDAGAHVMARALVGTHVRELDLSSNEISDDGATYLAKALRVNSRVTALNLRDNLIGSRGFTSLFLAVSKEKAVLEKLNMYSNEVSKVRVRVSKALSSNTTLTELNLGMNWLHLKSCISLAKGLQGNTVLRSLNLEWNSLQDMGVVELAKSLSVNTTLHSLNLNEGTCGIEGANALATTLLNNTTLTFLDVRNNPNAPESAWLALEAARNVHRTCVVVRD
jgi:Ran GTPase-activating protein (RanGAP) involved in mRNA processing and transport